MAPIATPAPGSRRPRAFFTQGFVFISLTTRLPKVQDHWHYSDTTLSLLLLMMVLLAGPRQRARRDRLQARRQRHDPARRAARASRWRCRCSRSRPTAPSSWPRWRRTASSLGAVDATTNMQAVALEHLYERPILPSFHGSWTLGGFLGSAVALAMGHLPVSATGVVAVLPLAIAFAPFLRRAEQTVTAVPPGPRAVAADHPGRAWRWCSSTWSTPQRSPGARSTSTRSSRPRRRWWRWRSSRTCSPAAWCVSRATPWWRGTAPCRCSAWAPWWPAPGSS